MRVRTVVGNRLKLTKDRAKALIASGLQRAAATHGVDALAMEAGCSRRCIEKALAHDSLPELHFILNALDLDPSILTDALADRGLRIAANEVAPAGDMDLIAEISALLTEWLDALKDGERDHTELLRIAARLRVLLPKLSAIVGEADRLRTAA